MCAKSISKKRRGAARVSLRSKPSVPNPISDEERVEITRLRAELKRLRQERDIPGGHRILREGVGVKCCFIDVEEAAFLIQGLCEATELSPSIYYARVPPRQECPEAR